MANRMFNQFQGSLEKGVVQLFAEITFDGVGGATIVRGKGISSISGGGGGSFFIDLQDSYVALLGVSFAYKGTVISAAPLTTLRTSTNVASATQPRVNFTTYSTAGVGTTPAAGESMLITITLSNSTAI